MSSFNINELIYEASNIRKDNNKDSNSINLKYEEALNSLRSYVSENYSNELVSLLNDSGAENRIKDIIGDFIRSNKIKVRNISSYRDLVNKLYDDMAGFAFLSKYIYDENVEEINGNSWDDIEIVTRDGWRKLDEHFVSPKQSIDIVKKMAKLGGVIVDQSCPVADSYITEGVRISVIIPPIVDENNGAAFSIRKQKIGTFSKEDFISLGTATEDELDFLILCIRHGVSVGIAGATSSGKTTDIGFLINNIPNDLRVFSIEDTRELSLKKRNNQGKVVNRVVQTKIRPSENKRSNITSDMLLKKALRFDPDIIIPAEMRGEEAQIAQEAGRTGHTIITSLHATTALAAYTRILTMCMASGTKLSEDILMKLIIEAFPIMVFKKQLPDRTRKYMRIIEAEDYVNGKIVGRTLFKYQVTGRELSADGNKIRRIIGEHRRVNPISNNLANRLLENGAGIDQIKRFSSSNWEPGVNGGEDHKIFSML